MPFKRYLKILALATFSVIVPIGAIWCWWRWEYYREFHAVEEKLRHLPGIKVETLWGNEDVTLEDIYAKISVNNKGTIMFLNLTSDSFEGSERIIISQIDNLHPRITGYGYNGVVSTSTGQPMKSSYWGYAIEVSEGPFAAFFPSIKTVQDAISNYDDIRSALNNWPRCPDYKVLRDAKGGIHCYCVGNEGAHYPNGCVQN